MNSTETKYKVFEAAVRLFNTDGYNGTSVRDIAKKAGVNVSLISYYFGGKKGLLEKLMIEYLEGYIEGLDQVYQESLVQTAKESLLQLMHQVLSYEAKHYQLARLVYREMTLDTVLVREIMTTYLTKEKYIFKTILEKGVEAKEFRKFPYHLAFTQMKGMLTMPYLHPQYMVEVLHIHPQESYFVKIYFNEMKKWVEGDLCHDEMRSPNRLAL